MAYRSRGYGGAEHEPIAALAPTGPPIRLVSSPGVGPTLHRGGLPTAVTR